MSRRAVFVCCDGLGAAWVRADKTPVLEALKRRAAWCEDHSGVFPSVTRVSAASIATGCQPARHGLQGNRMGLMEEGRIVVRDVGAPDFRTHLRRATGGTLRTPTLAERTAGRGGCIAYSNVSPGAAYFLDPDNHGHVHHRNGSFAPGGDAVEPLDVTHDAAGDWTMTERFCAEVLEGRKPAVALLWLCDPDHTLHGVPLGSPGHDEALRGAERCVEAVVRTVDRLRAAGEDILLMVGSDHGHETIGDVIDVEAWLSENGLADLVASRDVAVAGQGTSALLYATAAGRARLEGVLDAVARAPWAGDVLTGAALAAAGFAAEGGVVAAVDMARDPTPNPFGVAGRRWVAYEGKPVPVGSGQHGGRGPDETRPFLLVDDGQGAGRIGRPTSLVDIAPTVARHLGLALDGFDGRPLDRA